MASSIEAWKHPFAAASGCLTENPGFSQVWT